ncbi:MAG: response regulator [Bacteroidales bacterium]|jgi:two-component system response regulator YesN
MKRILVVDDNKLERRIITHILNEFFAEKVETDEAPEGLSAVEMLSRTPYDLIITDLIMPKLEGIELIRTIKSTLPKTSIIAMSGGMPYYLYLAKKMGIDGIFTKPVDRNKFLMTVQATLNISLAKRA